MPALTVLSKTSSGDGGRGKKSNLVSGKWLAADHATAHDTTADAAQPQSGG